MLNGAGNTTGYIQLGTDSLTGLAHLMWIGDPIAVDSRSGSGNGSAQGISQLADQDKSLLTVKAAPALHHNIRFGQFYAIRFDYYAL